MIKVAIIGFGGISKVHYNGYLALKAENVPVELVAVCDVNPERFDIPIKTNLDVTPQPLAANIRTYTDVNELLAKEDFDMADICLPTYLHKEYAVQMLNAGKHVLCEKPMALNAEECDEMIDAANRNEKKLMIAQCVRFSAPYLYLKTAITDGRFGKIRNLFMHRKSAQPRWGFEHWFEKTEKCGGAILDMHVHDIDMTRYLLGEPKAVSCMTYDATVKWAVENSRLYYDEVMAVVDCSWDESKTKGFACGFSARFEKAQVVYERGVVTVYPEEGEKFTPEIEPPDPYTEEIRFFTATLLDPALKNEKNPPESARETVKLIEKLRESADSNGALIQL